MDTRSNTGELVMKLDEKKLNRAVNNWLFEYSGIPNSNRTYDNLAGNLGDEESELPTSTPIVAMDQTAAQLTYDLPPIEDEEYVPENTEELSRAAKEMIKQVPHDQVKKFYEDLGRLVDAAIDDSRKKEIQDHPPAPDDIENPIKVKENKNYFVKSCVASPKTSYIKNVTNNGGTMAESRGKKSARQRDFARAWKQGDELKFNYDEDFTPGESRDMDDFDLGDLGDEFVPDAEDIQAFMYANDEDDPTKVPGFDMEIHGKEFELEDFVRSKVFPTAKRASAVHNKLEREINPVIRATQSAPQLTDRLMSLVRSNFAADAFLDAVYHADLMEEETIEQLREMSRGDEEQRDAFYKSDMYQFFASIAFVRPAMKELERLAKLGKDVFNPKRRKSQISPEDAKTIIKAVKNSWSRKNAAQMSRFAERAFENLHYFGARDKSVMG